MNVATQLTPCGRVPGSPLQNRRHERVAQELATGKNAKEACLAAGVLNPDGSSFAANARKLCQRSDIRERAAEITAQEARSIGLYSAWKLLSDVRHFSDSSLSRFYKFDAEGKLIVDGNGDPVLDFTGASKEELRFIKKQKPGKHGTEYEVHDPLPYLDRLGRYLGLWSGDGAVAVANASSEAVTKVERVIVSPDWMDSGDG